MARRDSQPINEIHDFREEAGHLAPNVDVQIGDRLKIYFDKQDSNVTYEAKVRPIHSFFYGLVGLVRLNPKNIQES